MELDALEDEVNAIHGDLWEQLNSGGQVHDPHHHHHPHQIHTHGIWCLFFLRPRLKHVLISFLLSDLYSNTVHFCSHMTVH